MSNGDGQWWMDRDSGSLGWVQNWRWSDMEGDTVLLGALELPIMATTPPDSARRARASASLYCLLSVQTLNLCEQWRTLVELADWLTWMHALLLLHAGIAPQIGGGDGDVGGGGVAGGGNEAELMEVRGKLAAAYERLVAPAVKLDICAREGGGGGVGQGAAAARAARRRGEAGAEWTTGWWAQFSVLLRRGLKERRHESFNKLRIFQVLSVASLAGLLWWRTPAARLQDRTALIFFFSVFWGFFPLYNAVFTFPLERPMLLKERSSGMYRLSSYFAARTAADLPMELALPTAFVIILYWMGGLDPHPAPFLLSLLVVLYSVLVAQSLGLAIGAVLMDVKQGTTLASVITMVFLIAGGYYVQHIPPFVGWLRWLNYSFYCYRLLLGIQFPHGGGYYDCGGGSARCPVAEFPSIKAVGLSNHWVDVCVMALLLIGYRVVAYLALDRLKPR
ncbi:hypothetical protein ABZP36_029654 [Zizania latifolia]